MLRRKILRDIACKQNTNRENSFTLLNRSFFSPKCTVPIHMVQKITENFSDFLYVPILRVTKNNYFYELYGCPNTLGVPILRYITVTCFFIPSKTIIFFIPTLNTTTKVMMII